MTMGPVALPADADWAVKDFLASADPALVRRFVAGQLTLAFAEVNPVVAELAGCSIEDAFAKLKAMGAAKRAKYGARTVVKTPLPTGEALIDRILTDLYGRTYRPPAAVKKTAPRAPKTATPKSAKPTPAEAVRQLQTATTRDEAHTILAQMGRTKAPYQEIADHFGVPYRASDTIATLTKNIADTALAPRRFEPLQRGGMR
jgi:hypothetical protein